MSAFTFVWITPTLEEIEEQMFRAIIDVKVSCVGTSRQGGSDDVGSAPRDEIYKLYSRVTELGFLDPNLVVWILRVNEGCEFIRRPWQFRQVHGSHIPLQLRNTRERPNRFLEIEALREGAAREGYQSQ